MIPVTKPFLPEKEAYEKYLNGIFGRNWLTNNGPLVNELELQLKKYLGLSHLIYVSNGTIALQLAIKALDIRGDIITTPFSYVATTSSIVWEGSNPIFADIDPESLNISPDSIRKVLTPDTKAILATHCFGNACDIDAIQTIADEYDLKVIYDAAHCFGTTFRGASIFSYGDISTSSFHATKLFHTVEGGAVMTNEAEVLQKLAYMRNFGHDGPAKFFGLGINGKNSEFHAAMGLCVLPKMEEILARRKEQSAFYDELLANLKVQKPRITDNCVFNYAYYPIIFETEEILLASLEELNKKEIFPRRYFYPSLSSLPYVQPQPTPISDAIAKRVLCLPLYHDLSREEQQMIVRVLLRVQRYH